MYVPWYLFIPALLLVALVLGFGVHSMLRRLGEQGVLDYVPRAPTKKSVGMAMMNFGVIYEPALEHVIEFEQSGDLKGQALDEPFPLDPDQEEVPPYHPDS
ncbi:MAG: hypothetical protein ACRDWH_08500 [Acidimicrobiia bacterium]